MTTTDSSEYEGTSGPLNTSLITVLPPVDVKFDIQSFHSGSERSAFSSAGYAVIQARWNFLQQINYAGVTNNHIVMASITEVFPNPASGQIDLPGIGDAHMYVRSVAPQNGKIFVNGYIDFDRNLNVRISLFVW
jgi:hypothetical protein